ncbi:DMT family transporter [Neorhizobium sp. BETTINA12A]|uniref:DMT family transporter n=1 Tax=Neorhizobium sp. BETTINA12A TaxID=2908924 RepID=UPI001FF4D3CF|nr:DMT family transporter [Neorhizobium sp. BETTINA12A]MCJ9751407.1 DMT family transporter [Neorhizobium sp. BETTINA12A]
MWMVFGISAGALLGLYDFWTKKAMTGNSVIPIVFWSAFFGGLVWLPAFFPIAQTFDLYVDLSKTSLHEQAIILIKGLAMTLSWIFAYYAVRELPMSFSGAVRSSGPLWTLVGGSLVFGEDLSALQMSAVLISVLAYYFLSQIGRDEGIRLLRSGPMFFMLAATILSAMTTVYDKYIVQQLGLPIYTIQAYSAEHRLFLALIFFVCVAVRDRALPFLQWSLYVPLVGFSWVGAEIIYFLAIADPDANVTYLSIFRRTSLVIGFLLSVLLLGERNVGRKFLIILAIVLSTVLLVLS